MSALLSIVAGPYSATYASSDIGGTKEGFELVQSFAKEDVIGDLYGDSVIDAVYRGGNCSIRTIGLEYSDAIAARNPYGADIGASGLIGRMDVGSSIAGALVLTAVSGTTAASAPATLTAAAAIIDKDFSDGIVFATKAREVPIQWKLYLTTVSTVNRWFSVT